MIPSAASTSGRLSSSDRSLVTTLTTHGYPDAVARERVSSEPDALAMAIAAHCPFVATTVAYKALVGGLVIDDGTIDSRDDVLETPAQGSTP